MINKVVVAVIREFNQNSSSITLMDVRKISKTNQSVLFVRGYEPYSIVIQYKYLFTEIV